MNRLLRWLNVDGPDGEELRALVRINLGPVVDETGSGHWVIGITGDVLKVEPRA